MNKTELINVVSQKAKITKTQAGDVLTAVLTTISDALAQGDKVQLVGFGTFETRKRAARKGRNPQTGEEIIIAPSVQPAFRAGKSLRRAVNR